MTPVYRAFAIYAPHALKAFSSINRRGQSQYRPAKSNDPLLHLADIHAVGPEHNSIDRLGVRSAGRLEQSLQFSGPHSGFAEGQVDDFQIGREVDAHHYLWSARRLTHPAQNFCVLRVEPTIREIG